MWSGGDGSVDTKARVSWDKVTLPTAQLGVGSLDFERKSRALLVKLLVRGLTPEDQPWKQFLLHSICQCTPPAVGWWSIGFSCRIIIVNLLHLS